MSGDVAPAGGLPAHVPIHGLLVDVDGVLRVDDRPIPGAADALRTLRERGLALRFLTNTSTRGRASLCRDLSALELAVAEHELFTAPTAAASYLHAAGKRRIFLLVKGDVVDDFAEFELAESDVEAVVVGGAEEGFTYERVNRAFQLVMDGAELIAIHRNRYWRTARGLQIDAGAYVAGLEYATGATATVVGKPSPPFFRHALADLGVPVEHVLVVGDDVETDVGGGHLIGARTALVQTGKFRPADLERADVRPNLVLRSIADLPAHIGASPSP